MGSKSSLTVDTEKYCAVWRWSWQSNSLWSKFWWHVRLLSSDFTSVQRVVSCSHYTKWIWNFAFWTIWQPSCTLCKVIIIFKLYQTYTFNCILHHLHRLLANRFGCDSNGSSSHILSCLSKVCTELCIVLKIKFDFIYFISKMHTNYPWKLTEFIPISWLCHTHSNPISTIWPPTHSLTKILLNPCFLANSITFLSWLEIPKTKDCYFPWTLSGIRLCLKSLRKTGFISFHWYSSIGRH